MSMPQPQHTAEEVAAFLRQEIFERDERVKDIADRRTRGNNRFSAEYEAAKDAATKSDIQARWSAANRDRDMEQKVAEAERFALRRTLQYLTGELWS